MLKSVLMDNNEGLYINITDLINRLNNIRLLPKSSIIPTPDPEPEPPVIETDYPVELWSSVQIGDYVNFRAWKITTVVNKAEYTYYNLDREEVFKGYQTKIYNAEDYPNNIRIGTELSNYRELQIDTISGTHREPCTDSRNWGELSPGYPYGVSPFGPEQDGEHFTREVYPLDLPISIQTGDESWRGVKDIKDFYISEEDNYIYKWENFTTNEVNDFITKDFQTVASPSSVVKITEILKDDSYIKGISDHHYITPSYKKARIENIIIYTAELPDIISNPIVLKTEKYNLLKDNWELEPKENTCIASGDILTTDIPVGESVFCSPYIISDNTTGLLGYIKLPLTPNIFTKEVRKYKGAYIKRLGKYVSTSERFQVTSEMPVLIFTPEGGVDITTSTRQEFADRTDYTKTSGIILKVTSSKITEDTEMDADGTEYIKYRATYEFEPVYTDVTVTYVKEPLSDGSYPVLETTTSLAEAVNYGSSVIEDTTYSYGDAEYNLKWKNILEAEYPVFITTLGKNDVLDHKITSYATKFSSAFTDSTYQTRNNHRIGFFMKDSEGKMRLLANFSRRRATGISEAIAVVTPATKTGYIHLETQETIQPNDKYYPALTINFDNYTDLKQMVYYDYETTQKDDTRFSPPNGYFGLSDEENSIGYSMERAPEKDTRAKLEGIYIVREGTMIKEVWDTNKTYYAKGYTDEDLFKSVNAEYCPTISANMTSYLDTSS